MAVGVLAVGAAFGSDAGDELAAGVGLECGVVAAWAASVSGSAHGPPPLHMPRPPARNHRVGGLPGADLPGVGWVVQCVASSMLVAVSALGGVACAGHGHLPWVCGRPVVGGRLAFVVIAPGRYAGG